MNQTGLKNSLETRFVRGLACEWKLALWVLDRPYYELMKLPGFCLKDMKNLGSWNSSKKEICLSRNFVMNHPWDSVREVLIHEMAHQMTSEVFRAKNEPPHGKTFQLACRLLRANPKASGNYETLHQRLLKGNLNNEDKILIKVKKLMALAKSRNKHEAEAAMIKAHNLIAKHNIDLFGKKERNFISIFIGKPALRHFREEYALASLLRDFYFVETIMVPAYVPEKEKQGRVLEISGTFQNVRFAGYVNDFINNYIDMKWRGYNKNKRLNRYRKTDFALGIISGFRSKLEASVKCGPGQIKSLILTDKDPLLKEYTRYRYPRLRKNTSKPLYCDSDVLNKGVTLGKKLVISEGVSHKGEKGKFLPG